MLSANGSAFMHAQDSGARGEVTCFGHSLRPHHLVAALIKPITPAISTALILMQSFRCFSLLKHHPYTSVRHKHKTLADGCCGVRTWQQDG